MIAEESKFIEFIAFISLVGQVEYIDREGQESQLITGDCKACLPHLFSTIQDYIGGMKVR